MNVLGGIYLLLWKNFKLKLRHPWVLLLEIGVPCLFSAILAIVRVLIKFDHIDIVTKYKPLTVDNWLTIQNKTILYAPRSLRADSLMEVFQNLSLADLHVLPFDDEPQLVAYYLKENADNIACGLVFLPDDTGERYRVKLRFPFVPKQKIGGFDVKKIDQFTWQTSRLFPMFQEPGPRAHDKDEGGPPNYYDEGFLYVQHHLTKSIAVLLNSTLRDTLETITTKVQRFP